MMPMASSLWQQRPASVGPHPWSSARLQLQSSGHQLPHTGLAGRMGPLRVAQSPRGHPCQAPLPGGCTVYPAPPPAPLSTGPGLTTSLERNVASAVGSGSWAGGPQSDSLQKLQVPAWGY